MKKTTFLLVVILLISSCGGTQMQLSSNKFIDQTTSYSNQTQKADNEKEFVEDWDYCGDLMKRSDYEDCLSDELKKLEKSLDKEYSLSLKRLKESYTKKDVVNLTIAQKNWQSYKEANCLAEKETYGEGTDAVGAGLQCYLKLTKERLSEIKRLYASK